MMSIKDKFTIYCPFPNEQRRSSKELWLLNVYAELIILVINHKSTSNPFIDIVTYQTSQIIMP